MPKMARIRQTFARPRVDDVAAEMREQMQVLTPLIRPGMTVGLTVGSRGIQNILTMLEVAVQAVRGCGASPVLLAAMGSHGGGTRQGQKDVLDSLGITEERLGAPVITCDVTRAIGETPGGLVAHMLESAFGVDAIIPINRVKTHTSFKGCVESGLCKKLVVGLGGPGGAGQFHSLGAELPRLLVEVTKVILGKMPVLGRVAIVENAYETARIKAIPAEALIEKKSGCWRGRSVMPALPTDGAARPHRGGNGERISAEPESTISSDGLRITGEPEMEARASVRFGTGPFGSLAQQPRAWALWTL
ncbi:MAG: hypothetical protein ACLR7Z_17655 [Bilophila wadsworthia]